MSNPKRYSLTLVWLEQVRDTINRAADQARMDRAGRDPDFETQIRLMAVQCQKIADRLNELESAEWEKRFP